MKTLLGRTAAILGMLGALTHLALAGEHAGHAPVIAVGLVLLSLVCVRCGVHLWRRPSDAAAWRDLIVLALVMSAVHFAAGITDGLSAIITALPLLQVGLAAAAFFVRQRPAPVRAS